MARPTPPRDTFDVMIGAIGMALLNSERPNVLTVVVLALVDEPAGGNAVRTAIAAQSEALGLDVAKLLRETADKIDAKHGLGPGIHFGPERKEHEH